ncbi:hypothetical protein L1987_35418 [Smallanthus sonchifolius]|uniref:Uncharacterized protein n=1 Tax=Smallanthus sonchifolius TaxID=185202 RepID=A0ACB9HVX9_9ASTR|nr:hypothetical protein L1987_35418 [Smallanthus sonchifolius]
MKKTTKHCIKNFRYTNNQSIQKQTLIESLVFSLSPTVAVFRRSFSKQTLIEPFCCGKQTAAISDSEAQNVAPPIPSRKLFQVRW